MFKGSLLSTMGGESRLEVFKGSLLATMGGESRLEVFGSLCVFGLPKAGGSDGGCMVSFG